MGLLRRLRGGRRVSQGAVAMRGRRGFSAVRGTRQRGAGGLACLPGPARGRVPSAGRAGSVTPMPGSIFHPRRQRPASRP